MNSCRTGVAAGAALMSAVVAVPQTALACAACGCTLGTEFAAQGYSTADGLRLDFRYDFVNQNQLRLDSTPVDKKTYVPADPDQEIQQGTLTRFYTVAADYTVNRDWGVNLQVPFLDREHETIATAGEAQTTSHFSEIGDVRILGRYQGFFTDRSTGLQFGLKLPTGRVNNRFDNGPQTGEQVDRGLQPGSGTTDILLGIYNHGAIGERFDRFEQLQFKQAINSNDGFRPATQVNANLGVRYVDNPLIIPQVQINVRWEGHEIGANADYANSGNRAVFVSPGVTVRAMKPLHVYSFVQLPVYQFYKGLELAPKYAVTVGMSYQF